MEGKAGFGAAICAPPRLRVGAWLPRRLMCTGKREPINGMLVSETQGERERLTCSRRLWTTTAWNVDVTGAVTNAAITTT